MHERMLRLQPVVDRKICPACSGRRIVGKTPLRSHHRNQMGCRSYACPRCPRCPRFGAWKYSTVRARLQPREALNHAIHNNSLDPRRADFERGGPMARIRNSFSGAGCPVFRWILPIYASAQRSSRHSPRKRLSLPLRGRRGAISQTGHRRPFLWYDSGLTAIRRPTLHDLSAN